MKIDAGNIQEIRRQFPILHREIAPQVPLVYLDSAATSQKPLSVIEAMDQFYREANANIHRGIHRLAERATSLYEDSRSAIAKFIHCSKSREIVFTRNATEAINLVAYTWGRNSLKPGDMIILTEMEHHSNLVPWQILAQEKQCNLEFIPVQDDGTLDITMYKKLLEKQPKLVSFTHMSNVLGTINPAKEMIFLAHQAGAVCLVDGAQSTPHFPVNVEDMDVDFFAFSAHKMCGPTGIGVLFGKEALLESMPPFLGGGDMIRKVELRSFKSNEIPYKFEAGTPAVAEAVGFGQAVHYLDSLGMEAVTLYEHELVTYAYDQLLGIPGLQVLGPAKDKRGGVIAFTLAGVHPHDVAQILDSFGIAIRAGHHCAMPLHERFHLPATSRASFYFYNMKQEIDLLVRAINAVRDRFK